jgi:hypothetical protein
MNKYIPTIVLKLPQVVEALYLDVCDKQSRILKKISMQRKIRKKISKVFCIFARLRTHLGHPRVNLLDCLSSVVLIFSYCFFYFWSLDFLGPNLKAPRREISPAAREGSSLFCRRRRLIVPEGAAASMASVGGQVARSRARLEGRVARYAEGRGGTGGGPSANSLVRDGMPS